MKSQIVGKCYGTAATPLSILDFVMAGKGYSAQQALVASIELAKLVDRRGFNRYWVAEHHSLPGVTTSSYRSTELIADAYGLPNNVVN